MKTVTTTISERVKVEGQEKGVNKEIGKVSFLVPTLEEVKDHLNKEGSLAVDEKENYTDDFTSFVADAIEAACKVKLVSRLEPKSINFKSGQSAWTTIAELVEAGQRGQHFAIAAAFKTAISTFIAGLKKSDGFKAAVLGYCLTPKALAETTVSNKAIVEKVLAGFLETLDEDEVVKYDRILTELGTSIAFQGSSLEDEE